jgi:hypothetical protein
LLGGAAATFISSAAFSKPVTGLWIRVVVSLLMSLYLLRSGLTPKPDEPQKWPDRAIRIVGGVIFGSGALFGIARIMGWVANH